MGERFAAVISVSGLNIHSPHPAQPSINPEEIWRYLKDVPTPDNACEERCSICLEVFTKTVTQAPCGHLFHKKCIREWLLNTKKDCPMCRFKVYAAPPPAPAPFDAVISSPNPEDLHDTSI